MKAKLSNVELKLTNPELKKMVEICAIAEWVLTAQDEEEDPRKDDYLKVLQKVYSLAHSSGMVDEIEHLEDINEYFPSDDWEEGTQARSFIEEFEEKSFWAELINRLTDRDIEKKLKGKNPNNFEEYYKLFDEESEKYIEEFGVNDLENVAIVKK